VTSFLYVMDNFELSQRGEDTELEDAAGAVVARAEDARAKQEAVAEAQARTETMSRGRDRLQGQLNTNRSEFTRFCKEKTDAALTCATANNTANARAFGQITQRIEWLSMALTTCDAVMMPAQILNQRRAEAVLLRSMGNLLTASAIEAAVLRHAAARTLLEQDGVVTIGAAGRAYEILMQALEFHRRASEAEKSIHAEERRLAMIQAAEGKL
jgi:hypothetical protein